MATSFPAAHVETPTDPTVKVIRDFKAPPELVWQAYTEPKLIRRWLTAMPGWSMPVCEMDVRVGGKYRWFWRMDDGGMSFGFDGEFLEIKAPHVLKQTQIFDPGTMGGTMGEPSIIAMTLEWIDGVTRATTVMDYGSKASRDAAMATGMTDGMEISYGALDKLVAELAS